METVLKRTISTLLVLLTFYGYGQAGLRSNKLAHSHFVHFGVRQVTLDFIDNHTCILSQSIQMALPSGPVTKKDTLRYHIDNKTRISFTNLSVSAPLILQKLPCEDYSALCYKSAIYISRNGQMLKDYPITAEKITWLYKHTFLVESLSSIYAIPQHFKGYYSKEEHMMVLHIDERHGFGFFLQMPEDVQNAEWESFFSSIKPKLFFRDTKPYDMLREDWGFCWYSRPRYTPVASITSEIIGHQFAYERDTLSFLDDSICLEHKQALNTSAKRSYSIDGAYIILNHPTPTKQVPDTLLYKDGIIYNAMVCQTTDSIKLHQGIGPYSGTPYPTGTMTVFTYEDVAKESVPDSVIGYVFQHYFMPINYRRVSESQGQDK